MEPIDRLAGSQHALLTHAQLRQWLTDDQIQGLLDRGLLVAIFRGVYRVIGSPPTWEQSLLAACLASGGVASHRSAGRLWGLPVPAQRLELTVGDDRRVRLPGVVAHRSNILRPRFVTARAGIPVTTGPRTVVDCISVLTAGSGGRVIDEADYIGVAGYLDVDEIYRAMRQRGRRRFSLLEQLLLPRLEGLEGGDRDWEKRISSWLVRAGFPPPTPQLRVLARGHPYVLDLAYEEHKIDLEFDGWDVHRGRGHFDSDRRRTRNLELDGWLVLAFTSAATEAEVVADVDAAITLRSRLAS